MARIVPERLSSSRYRCRYCGAELPVWLPVANAVDGAMRLHHLSRQHPGSCTSSLRLNAIDLSGAANKA
jgi:hypothetical protein